MEVNISDLVSSVRVVDENTVLSPRTMERIVEVVLRAIRERENHQSRVRAEQQITGGVRAEMEGEM